MSESHLPTEDVPESLPKQADLGRRRFLETGVWTVSGVVGLTLFGIGGRFAVGDSLKAANAQWVKLGAVADFSAGHVHQAAFTMRQKDAWSTVEKQALVYVFSADGATYTILSAICTHLGCNVHWHEESSGFRCPCHDAYFSQQGEVISGPPRRALTRLESKIEDNILLVLI